MTYAPASTKRVNGNYNIYANLTTIHGNLTVIGNTTSITTNNSAITDNILILNSGETGSGVTQGTSGLDVDRGSLPNAYWLFNEANVAWEPTINGSLSIIKAADPVDNEDVVTKNYLLTSGSSVAGPDRSVQFNNSGLFGGVSDFSYYANGNVFLGNTIISNTNLISTTNTNDLIIDAGGTTYLKDILKLSFQTGPTPTNVASTIQLLANTPGQGGSGLFIVNNTGSDELVSKRKATWLGLVFS